MHVLVWMALRWFSTKVTFGPGQMATIREAAERGRVVYVMQSRSLFDQLYFNWAFLTHSLPLARWSNGIRTMFLRPFFSLLGLIFRRRDRRTELEKLASCVQRERAALVFLERPLDADSDKRAFAGPALERLLETQQSLYLEEGERARPMIFVPLMVVWERRSEDFRPGLLDGIFGSRQSPGFFRKILHVIKNIWQPFILLGAPLVQVGELTEVEAIPPETDISTMAELLRLELTATLEQQRSVVVGPRHKKGAVIKGELMEDAGFGRVLEHIALDEGRDLDEVRAQARQDLDAIASDFRLLAVKFMAVLLSPVFQLIYDGLEVDEEGLERVRQAARDHRLVVIPSHKSHIDYLIVSTAFYTRGLMPPHIVAGDNLDFPPVGTIFRRSGAFFIKRSFKGDEVYAQTLAHYMGKILSEGYPIEFFIEGGRSRTGKLLTPRFGVLRMILDRLLAGDVDKLKIVPVSVTYERVIEAGAHQKELVGGEKRQENLGALLRSTRVLTSKYGRLYVDFGELIDVPDYVARYDIEASASDEELARLVQRLGYRVIYEINQAGPVTPSALTSLALLTIDSRSIGRARLLKIIGFVLELLVRRGVRLSGAVRKALASKRAMLKSADAPLAPDDAASLDFLIGGRPRDEADADAYTLHGRAVGDLIDEAIKLFSDGKLVELTTLDGAGNKAKKPAGDDARRFYFSVPEARRGELSYYKNTILHALVPEALLSAALLEPGKATLELDALMERTLFLSKLFKYEFFYEERAEFDRVFWRVFTEFEARGWVEALGGERTGPIRVAQPAPALSFFRRLVLTFLESYTLVAVELRNYLAGRWVDEKDFVEHLLLICKEHYHEGRVRFSETLAKPTFVNAIRRFADWGHVESRTDESRRKPMRQYRLADTTDYEVLVDRLRCLLRTRPEVESRSGPNPVVLDEVPDVEDDDDDEGSPRSQVASL